MPPDGRKLTKRDLVIAVLSWIDPSLAGLCAAPVNDVTITHVETALGEFIAKPERMLEAERHAAQAEHDSRTREHLDAARRRVDWIFPEIRAIDESAAVDEFGLVAFEVLLTHAIGRELIENPPAAMVMTEVGHRETLERVASAIEGLGFPDGTPLEIKIRKLDP